MEQKQLHSAPSAITISALNGSLPQFRPERTLDALMRLLDRAKQRNDLSALSDDQLADIGVTRREAAREAGKWFWE
jgi:uncharacterized protein YjiS (DUF1127 family)